MTNSNNTVVDSSANLRIWSKVSMTDPEATKRFNRPGGFKGTAVNATYLARQATSVFGPMGIGWGVDILDECIMEGRMLDTNGTRELIHKVRVKLWYVLDGKRGEITHFGQTQFVGSNSYGTFCDEEAPKKSLTDGMSKCLSLLGFGADVHLGLYDDNKYVAEVTKQFAAEKAAKQAAKTAKPTNAAEAAPSETKSSEKSEAAVSLVSPAILRRIAGASKADLKVATDWVTANLQGDALKQAKQAIEARSQELKTAQVA